MDLQVYQKKIEGDGVTPLGIFRLLSIYYRSRVGKIFTKLPEYKINRHMGWSDDPKILGITNLLEYQGNLALKKFSEDKLMILLLQQIIILTRLCQIKGVQFLFIATVAQNIRRDVYL